MTSSTDGQPTSIPEDTFELYVGQKIENGDLKWHDAANEWTQIQTIGYRIVKACQKGLFRRHNSKKDPSQINKSHDL